MSMAVMSLPGGKVGMSSPVPSARNRILPSMWLNSRSLNGFQRTSGPFPAMKSKVGAALSHFFCVATSTISHLIPLARDPAQPRVHDPDEQDPDQPARRPEQRSIQHGQHHHCRGHADHHSAELPRQHQRHHRLHRAELEADRKEEQQPDDIAERHHRQHREPHVPARPDDRPAHQPHDRPNGDIGEEVTGGEIQAMVHERSSLSSPRKPQSHLSAWASTISLPMCRTKASRRPFSVLLGDSSPIGSKPSAFTSHCTNSSAPTVPRSGINMSTWSGFPSTMDPQNPQPQTSFNSAS